MQAMRTEQDSLGALEIPADALYGVQSLRAQQNFDISPQKLADAPALLRALARIKKAAALANHDIGALPEDLAQAIAGAADEVAEGRHDAAFIVDLMEGSGGTSINMNMNEVLANRGLELLGERAGSYHRLHPNDHVNMGQSTNDVVPAAVKLALFEAGAPLVAALTHLAERLSERARAFDDVLRIGRTCMQGAQPMRLGQAFGGYAAAVGRLAVTVEARRQDMLVLPLGGTAIGTGLGAAPGYREAVYVRLASLLNVDVRPGGDIFDAMQNADGFARLSAEIRIAAEVVGKIAGDLVLLGSDPNSGLGELRLPAVQPGSSIMPGKVNPVLPMMMQQVAYAVIGNDNTVSLAALSGQLEINHFEPVIASRMLDSIGLLTRSMRIFADRCIAGIEADRDRSLQNLMQSSALATVFVPDLGYAQVASLVKRAQAEQRPFSTLAIESGLLGSNDLLRRLEESTGEPQAAG